MTPFYVGGVLIIAALVWLEFHRDEVREWRRRRVRRIIRLFREVFDYET